MNHSTITNNCVTINNYCMPSADMLADSGSAAGVVAASREELNSKFGAEAVNKALMHLMVEGLKGAVMDYIKGQNGPQAVQDEGLCCVEAGSSGFEQDLSPELLEEVRESPAGQHASGLGMADLVERFAEDQSKREFDRVDEATGVNQKKRSGGAEGTEGSSGGESSGGGSGSIADGGGNWLILLALKLAEIQDMFLTAAMEATEVMADNANYDDKEEKSETGTAPASGSSEREQLTVTDDSSLDSDEKTADKAEFLRAQAKYSASIQMFTTMANQTATSIKSIGEGLSAISRKQ